MKRARSSCRALVTGALLALALVPGAARSETALVAVSHTSIDPQVLFLDPGNEVLFDIRVGEHRLATYRGPATWDSGTKTSPATYQVGFDGGTTRYRCLIHSSLDSTGYCTGLCGIVTDDPDIDVTRPEIDITTPRSGEVVVPVPVVTIETQRVRFPVRIEGFARDNVAVGAIGVRVWDNAARATDLVAQCPGCGSARSVTWHAEISLLPGTYLVEASAADTSNNRQKTDRRMFIVV